MTQANESPTKSIPPPAPPDIPSQSPARTPGNSLETYNTIAETVGGLPSLRWKDNVVQLVVVAAFAVVLAGVGAVIGGIAFGASGALGGAIVGALAGIVVGGLGSGVVLMVIGWFRAAEKLK